MATLDRRARRWSDPVRDLSRERRHLRTRRLHRVLACRPGPHRSGGAVAAPTRGEVDLAAIAAGVLHPSAPPRPTPPPGGLPPGPPGAVTGPPGGPSPHRRPSAPG